MWTRGGLGFVSSDPPPPSCMSLLSYCLVALAAEGLRALYIDSQCCGAGAGGAEIIWDLEPDPEPTINLNKHFLQSAWRMLGRRKANFYLYYIVYTYVVLLL